MDDRGRIAESLTGTPRPRRARSSETGHAATDARRAPLRWRRALRAGGLGLVGLLIGAGGLYVSSQGDRLQQAIAQALDARDTLANAAGFRIAEIALSGEKEVGRERILGDIGVNGRRSLPFLDAEAARLKLKANPWIAEATILKLYPDRLHISVIERRAFALWQRNGQISVIAADGTVVQSFVDARFAQLPLVVGQGAEREAKDFLALLDRYPVIRDQLRASILVADRRWNLKLKNGLDIKLPETEPESALASLVALDRDKKLLSRDIAAVDLRLPDRVTVQLSEQAAQARAEIVKERKVKRKGGDA